MKKFKQIPKYVSVLVLIFMVAIPTLVIAFTPSEPKAAAGHDQTYMFIDGIEGSCTQEGKEGSVVVLGFHHQVKVPIDPATGGISGTRRHSPIRIVKEVDKSSPLLFHALCTSSLISEIEIQFWSVDNTGTQVEYYSITVEDCRIVEIETHDSDAGGATETISIVYKTIEWVFTDGNLAYQDSWSNPVV